MATNALHARVEALRRLTRRGAGTALKRTVSKSRPQDIATAIGHLAPTEQRLLFSYVDDEQLAADVLATIEDRDLPVLLKEMDFDYLLVLLEHMEPDDEADLITRLPDELQARILEAIKGEDKDHVEEILAWPEDSAGSIMSPLAFRLQENLTCRDAIAELQSSEELEMVFYVYIENEAEQLVGVTSLRSLLTHPAATELSEIMARDIISVRPESDQEDVANVVDRYDLLAVPVVDEQRHLLGIVTIDDVVDVIKEEAAEDMLRMAGVGSQESASAFSSARDRMVWLLVTLAGGIGMAELVGFYEHALSKEAVLAGFIPVMMGMGGNVGIQAATIAVRNITTGAASMIGAFSIIFREARVGTILGIAFAVLLGSYAALRHGQPLLGTAIAISTITEMAMAAAFGAMVPLSLNRIGVDPAIATGPFVTTCVDLAAIFIYFNVCMAILGL